MRGCANDLKRLNLELGGKSPLMVFDDANFDKAVGTAAGLGFYNAGQLCTQPSRLIVQEGIYD